MENETIFLEIFGNNPVMKVIDFLITYQLYDYPLTEIARNSNVSYSTLQTFWDRLEKNNKEAYLFLSDEINFSQLENFNFIQSWINTACPRIVEDFSCLNGEEALKYL